MFESYEIKPYTQAGRIPTDRADNRYPLEMVLPVVGMNVTVMRGMPAGTPLWRSSWTAWKRAGEEGNPV